MWIVQVLPLGVLDGIIWFGSLSGHLVSSGRQAPWKCAKPGDSAIEAFQRLKEYMASKLLVTVPYPEAPLPL
jgi:hypothetical protein